MTVGENFRKRALTAPVLVFLTAFMVVPLLLMLYVSFLERAPFGGVLWNSHTTSAYQKLLVDRDLLGNVEFNSDYINIFLRSFKLAAITTILTLLVSVPTALYMTTLDAQMGDSHSLPRNRSFLDKFAGAQFCMDLDT